MLKEQELTKQRAEIVKEFYRSYDPALIRQCFTNKHQLGLELGEGRHFRSYRLRGQGTLELAINFAKPSFFDSELGSWKSSLKRLGRINHPLLPPFELVEDANAEILAYVLPYCEKDLPRSTWPVLGVERWLEDFTRSLSGAGLWLDDYLQLRSCRNHPFVIDYSDLKPLG